MANIIVNAISKNAEKENLTSSKCKWKMSKYFFCVINMINMSYLEYIIESKREGGYYDILVDIYISYYGVKPTENQIYIYVLIVICLIFLNII